MFVMLFGLMGVAAIFPVGNHYAAKGEQYDRGAVLAGSAFAEVKARGLLQPNFWVYSDGTSPFIDSAGATANAFHFPFVGPSNPPGPGHAFVIDPLGSAQAAVGDTLSNYFPYNANYQDNNANPWLNAAPQKLPGALWPVRRVTLPVGTVKMGPRVAEAIFRLRDDVVGELPTENDRPGMQRWQVVDTNNTPKFLPDDTPLARAYAGNYSWLATVQPTGGDALLGLQPANPRYGSYLYEVSVAVFHKREDIPAVETERAITAELGPGGDLLLYSLDAIDEVDAAVADIRATQWIAVAGVHPVTGKFLMKWYRLLSVDDETARTPLLSNYSKQVYGRHAMLEGPEWPTAANIQVAPNLQAILLPGVIGVSTQTLKIQTD